MSMEIEIIPGSFKHDLERKEDNTIVERFEWSTEIVFDTVYTPFIPSPGRWRKGKKAYKTRERLWNRHDPFGDTSVKRLSYKRDTLADRFSRWQDSNKLDQHWMCQCGNYEESGLHCSVCGNEPPWGCPCSMCDSFNDEDEPYDELDVDEEYDPLTDDNYITE